MSAGAWRAIGLIAASALYWTVALAGWFALVLVYGDGATGGGDHAAVAACQHDKALRLWGTLGVLALVFEGALFAALRRRRPAASRNDP